jgi:uncharacterized protein (DUF362 family)
LSLKRRDFLALGAVGAAGAYTMLGPRQAVGRRPTGNSPVAVLKAVSYDGDLADIIFRGVKECGLDVRGKKVLLKPNLVEFDAATCINTDPRVIVAAVEVFERLGAAEVMIGEGPGHRRDTLDLADQAKYFHMIPGFERRFTDLNRDDVSAVQQFIDSGPFYFPHAALRADLIVSMAKMKTHHWAGATLSMKNFFGVVPGSVYGWPKNQLHYYGIDDSIIALNKIFGPKSFAIVDGIVGMEGNGPIQGTPKNAGVIVLGRDLVAVDSTCCRVMGLNPDKIRYLANSYSGQIGTDRIDQRGEAISSVLNPFSVLPAFNFLKSA